MELSETLAPPLRRGAMDLLFIHGNYPAQFVHLARSLGRQRQHRVLYLTNRQDPEVWPLAGVEVRRYDPHREPAPQTHSYLHSTEEAVLRGQAVARGVHQLLQGGFRPKLVFFHGGNGLGLFLRQLLPDARLVSYMEWWFHDELSRCLFSDYSFDRRLRVSMRNGVILQELEFCDLAVTPTRWQWQQFPLAYRSKIEVVFDGVDTDLFQPRCIERELVLEGTELEQPLHLPQEDLVLSYATRGMEPLRGFPEFMRMLPPLLARFPALQVVIAGQDRVVYSYPAPGCDGSWKRFMLQELKDVVGLERVHFTGSLNYRDYQLLLCRSDLHVYFTRSYVTSWGLFQAAASGSYLMVNRDPATTYVLDDDQALWVDLDDHESLKASAASWLDEAMERRGRPRTTFLQPEWDLVACLKSWDELLNRLLASASAV